MSNQTAAEEILVLAGEGGALKLYCVEKDGTHRFAWDSIWQVPDEQGNEPIKTAGWKAKEYATLSDAIDAAPKYWLFLAPVFVAAEFREVFWNLASARLAESEQSSQFIEDCLSRWERACRGVRRGRT